MAKGSTQYHRSQVIELAAAIVNGSIRPLLGARTLVGHLHQLSSDVDPEIVCFIIGVNSETDHLPLGEERKLWAEAALREIADAYEAKVGPKIVETAKKLLAQFSGP